MAPRDEVHGLAFGIHSQGYDEIVPFKTILYSGQKKVLLFKSMP